MDDPKRVEKRLENITYRSVNGHHVTPEEAFEIRRLARLGLWAENHGVPALESFEEWEQYIRGWNPVSRALRLREEALEALPKEVGG